MPSLKLFFDSFNRPLVNVEGKPDLPSQQQFFMHPPNAVPSFNLPFLVDTGASGCIVEEQLIASWHLMKRIPTITNDPKTGQKVVSGYKYPLSLRLHLKQQPGNPGWYHGAWPVSTVNDGRFDDCDFKGIIGMDMLRLGALSYVGDPSNTCELSW
jgi:hypothetical protein